ncbi:MAG: hypothetical protein JNM88_19250 [Chitinophagaceae bacterium]|nr:hypothetical protein [Chitinophagaceae bacterium]
MKKVLLVLAMAGVFVACGDKKKSDKPTTGGDTATTSTTPPANETTTTTPSTGTPTFADAEVQKYVDDYTAFVNSYLEAVKGKDMGKMSDLSMKASEWSSRSTAIAQKLASSPDEAKKFSDYMMKLSADWTEAAKAMIPTGK